MIQKFKLYVSTYMKKTEIFQTSQHGEVVVLVLCLFLGTTAHIYVGQLETAHYGCPIRCLESVI